MAELHTHLLEGAARVISPPLVAPLTGGWLRASAISIDRAVCYRQWSDACMLHVTLDRRFALRPEMPSRAARGSDRRGAVSFLPAGHERAGKASCGSVVGAEVSLTINLIEEMCEQRLAGAWRSSHDVQDARAFAIVEALVGAARQVDDPLIADTLTAALARHLGRRHGDAKLRRDDAWLHPAALRRVVERIHALPAEPPRLSELAGLAGLGISAFLRGFRGSVGTTPAAFCRRVRIEHAARLLKSDDMPLGDIAEMTGFVSASHLVRAFRAQRGETPANWRRSARNDTKSA